MINAINKRHQTLKIAKFQPKLKICKSKPNAINCIEMRYKITFTLKIMKMQGGSLICTDLHLMCISTFIRFLLYFAIGFA